MAEMAEALGIGQAVRTHLSAGVAGVVAAGQLLVEVRRSLPRGGFGPMLRTELGWNDDKAERLMAVARHEVLADSANFAELPASPNTLYELTKVPLADLRRAIATGRVHPDMRGADVHSLRRLQLQPPITKPDLGGGVSHPARFSDEVLAAIRELLAGAAPGKRHPRPRPQVLDPFAGTGRIHELRPDLDTFGIEIEPEWAALSEHTDVGDVLALPFDDEHFDAIATSPCFGNRLADAHAASDPERRRSYTHDLGRPLHPHNAGALQWGQRYRKFHLEAWDEAVRVLRPGGLFVLNIKDHTRDGARQPVSSWHMRVLVEDRDLVLEDCIALAEIRHLRQGSNADARWAELVWLLRKP